LKYAYVFFCLFCFSAFAQKTDSLPGFPAQDSLQLKKSQNFYRNLQEKSGNSEFTKMLHGLLFEPVDPADKEESIKTIETQLNRNFSDYQGKIIRNIKITTLDPFGYNEKDTTIVPKKGLDKIGNALHGKTKEFTVRGLLLIKENENLDSLKILESERLLRRRNFVRRTIIRPEEIETTKDSVDLHVYVLDSWSLQIDGDASANDGEIRLRDYNIFGLGHQVTTTYKRDYERPNDIGYTLGYRARNLYQTYIDVEVTRDVDTDQSYENLARVNRDFYSPYTRWAGEISVRQQSYEERFFNITNDSLISKNVKTQTYNTWGGFAIPIANKDSDKELPTNLILSARYSKLNFLERPDDKLDSVAFFSNENILLGSVGIRKINYLRDRYIFRNGDIEDIAIGRSYFINSGVQRNPNSNSFYLGLDVNFANYFKDFGYLAVEMELGSYLDPDIDSQSILSLKSTYFSPIFHIGRWYMRQFVKSNMVVGFNRKEIIKDRINLNDEEGIQDFNSSLVFGTRKFVFSFQTQSYVPFSWLGFRMSPFIGFDIGFIGEEPDPFFANDLYGRVGFGFLISNDYFVFDSIRLSFSVFPKVPGEGKNIMKFNGSYDNLFNLDSNNYKPPHIVEYR